ncbi:MAG: AsmA family protein [Candidatus Omnitrophica bacterium]|nr:AsmA family protein [Candidatus Omnitrophota bacterium]
MKNPLNRTTSRIALIFAVIFFIFSAGLFYVNKIFLPIQVREIVIKSAQDALKRHVTFDTLQYSPLRGFVISDLAIAQKDAPDKPFFKAKSISAQIVFFALLQKKVIIPALQIDMPEVFITRLTPQTWDFSDLLTLAQPAAPSAPKGPDVIISGFTINGGRIHLKDLSLEEPFDETLSLALIKGSLSMGGTFNINGDIALTSTNGILKFDTRIGLNDSSFKGTFTASNIVLSRYLRFSPTPLPLSIQHLAITDTTLQILSQPASTTISGDINLPAISLTLNDGTQCQGDIALTRFSATQKKNDLNMQGVLLGNKLNLLLPSGMHANLGALRLPNAQASLKGGLLNITGDVTAKELSVQLNKQQSVSSDLDIRNFSVIQNNKGYAIAANIDAQNIAMALNEAQHLTGHVLLNRIAASIAGNAMELKADVDIKNAAFAMPGTSVTASITAPGTSIAWRDGELKSSLEASFHEFIVKAQNMTAAGSPQLSAHMTFNARNTVPLTYDGTLEVPSLTVTGLPTVGSINNIHGNITFDTNHAQTKSIILTAFNTPVTIAGELTHFEAPQLDVTASAKNVNLNIIEKILPALIKEQGLNIGGTAAVDIHFQGALADPQAGKINALVDLSNTRIESKKLGQTISELNGHFEYNAPSLTWQDLTLTHQGKVWNSHGSLQNLAAPELNAFIKTEDLSADIDAQKKGDTITLNAIQGTWFDSTFALKGSVLAMPGKDPVMKISSDIKLTLRDLPKMLPPATAKQIDALKLAGILRIKSDVEGVPQQWQDLVSTTSIETPAFYMMGYQISDLAINARQKNGNVDPLSLTGTLYGGTLKADATVDLKGKAFPFTLKTKLDGLDLELLKKDTPSLRQQQLAGLLTANAELGGALLDIRKAAGTAAVNISKGYLWQLEILSKVLSILSTSFQGGEMVITDASATLKITDQKVMTSDLTLKGATVSLLGEGWVDFDQNVDLNITPRLEAASTPTGTVNPLDTINPTAGLVNIRVYGTLSAPKFENNLSAPQIIKKTLQNAAGSIFKLFE